MIIFGHVGSATQRAEMRVHEKPLGFELENDAFVLVALALPNAAPEDRGTDGLVGDDIRTEHELLDRDRVSEYRPNATPWCIDRDGRGRDICAGHLPFLLIDRRPCRVLSTDPDSLHSQSDVRKFGISVIETVKRHHRQECGLLCRGLDSQMAVPSGLEL
jgi:hypothetical protein